MSTKFIDLTGKQFASWTVISRAPNSASRRTMWNCRCSCGAENVVTGCHLVSGASSGCRQCFNKRITGNGSPAFKHGHRRDADTYSVWCNMIQRCENPNNDQYADYGGRGILICSEWRNDYRAFIADMGPRPSADHQIDRKNNHGGYELGNCRWATRSENMMNTRRAIIVTFRGERIPLAEACKRSGAKYHSAKWSIYRGKSHGEISP